MALPDSPLAPEQVHAPRGARPLRWLFVGVGVLALLTTAGWWSQRPLARIPLSDGGELLLLEAHYGPTIHVEEHIGLGERLRHLLSSQRHTPLTPPDTRDVGDPAGLPRLWLIFERTGIDGRTPFIGLACVDSIQDGLILDNANPFEYGGNEKRHYRVAVGLQSYPRRDRELHLRIEMETQAVDTTICNPFPVTHVPQWTPEPIPQTRRLGPREVVLRSLRRTPRDLSILNRPSPSFSIEYEIAVHEPGVPPDAIGIIPRLSDATGNESWSQLPAREPAWKIHAIIQPGVMYPFPAAEVESLGRIVVPGPGECHLFTLPADAAARTIRYAAFVGPGTYRVQYDHEPSVEPAPPGPVGARPPSSAGQEIIECRQPEVLLFGHGSFFANEPPPGATQWCRAVCETGNHHLTLFSTFHSRDNRESVGCALGFQSPPPAGMELEIQLITSHEESVDFYVQPPP